jgi:outer membrane protein
MLRTAKTLSLALALLMAHIGRADTLWDVYQLARQNDPLLREADANRLAIREAKPQARGALLPQISGSANYDKVNTDGFRTGVTATPTGGVQIFDSASESDVTQKGWSLDLRQTLFRWDQWVIFRQADKQALQADIDYRVAELNLYTRVADAYFNVLAAEDTLASTTAAREAIGRQLEQAQKRFEVGLIAVTDVQEAQSGYDQSVAAEIVAKRTLANTKEVLREIIGDYPGGLAKPGVEIPLISPSPADENQWVELALQQNLSLQSAQLDADIARDNISIARAGHLPSIDLVGSTGTSKQEGDTRVGTVGGALSAPRPNDSETNTDIIGVQLNLPIFLGGATNSRVRQNVFLHRAAKERLEATARQTERQTRDAFQAVNSDISRVRALQQALRSAQVALQATEAGFEVGTRTTVDVLESRRQLYLAETNYARSRYDYIVNVLKLKEAAGTLGDKDVQEVNAWLQPVSASVAPAEPVAPAPQTE